MHSVQLNSYSSRPASAEDVADMQAQMAAVANDPNLTIGSYPYMSTATKSASPGKAVSSGKEVQGDYKVAEINTDIIDDERDSASLKFNEDIKILLIKGPDWRLTCNFLGVNAVRDVKVARSEAITMIGFLQQECLIRCMDKEGFSFAGEISFDNQGDAVPVSKTSWKLKNQEIIFTNSGYMFFDAGTGNKSDNMAFMVWTNPNAMQAGITCYSNSITKSKNMLEKIENYAKKHNCLRGAKLRDAHVATGTFTEVVPEAKYSWDNYYFSEDIKKLFKLEVFGFLKETERYNARGIKKRGLLLYGQPGTGKTTIGRIICNYAEDKTVLWITPDLIVENNTGKMSVKLLYLLAEYVSPAVILLEDLDLFTEDRDNQQGNMGLGSLMNILDGVNSVENAVTVATTNRLELIEKALSNRPGRFDSVVEIPALNDKLRRKMFTDRMADCKVDEGVIDVLVKRSDAWTGAETQEFINRMNLYFINKNEDEKRHVTMATVEDVLGLIDNLCLSHKTGGRKKGGFGFSAA